MDYIKYKLAILTLNSWNKAYYGLGETTATDDEYDNLFKQVKVFEEDNPTMIHPLSPSHRVGHTVSTGFKTHKHLGRMYSQQDFFNIDDVVKWALKIEETRQSLTYVGEAKYDGLSLSLTYDNGVLIKATTRGDGGVGEDVTENAKQIASIPMTIFFKWKLEIHGEVVMSFNTFEIVNEKRVKENIKPFSNPRNAAVGILKSYDSNVVKNNPLTFIAWSFGFGKPKNINSLIKLRELLSSFAFKAPTQIIVKGHWYFEKAYKSFVRGRPKRDYPIDGIVFKVGDVALHNEIGYTAKFPKWSCAMKFEATEKTTKILDIINQVGRTGIITPVAVVKRVVLDGSIVERATLHNYSEIKNKDIRIGDEVIIIKSGDIIPKITTIFKDRRDNSVKETIPPTVCPNCGFRLVKRSVELVCPNENCSSRILMKLVHFVGKDYMAIDSVGPKFLKHLLDKNVIKDYKDLYKLTPEDIYNTGGVTLKQSTKLVENINKSKITTVDKFVAALGIPNFGRTIAKQLAKKYGIGVLDLTREILLSEEGIGEKVADNYINFMNENGDTINFFKDILSFTHIEKQHGKLENETVTITGTFPDGKNLVKSLVEFNGGDVTSSVGRKTTMVIYGEKAGKKLSIAKELKIKTLTLNELKDFLTE